MTAFGPVKEEMLATARPPVFVCLIRPTTGAVGGGTEATAADDDGLLKHRCLPMSTGCAPGHIVSCGASWAARSRYEQRWKSVERQNLGIPWTSPA